MATVAKDKKKTKFSEQDAEPLTPAQQRLVESVYGWCWREAHRAAAVLRHRVNVRSSYDDLVTDLFHAAVAEVCIGARRYDERTGFTPTTYLAWYCRRGIQHQVRQYSPIGPSFSTEHGRIRNGTPRQVSTYITVDGDEFEYVQDHPTEAAKDRDAKSDLMTILDRLDERSRMMVDMLFLQKMTYREISEIFGISKTRVQQIVKHAIERLRERFRPVEVVA